MMNDVPVLDKEMSTTGKNLSDSIVEKYAFVFQSCDVNMKLLVENKVSHYPASDVLLKKARFENSPGFAILAPYFKASFTSIFAIATPP